jgi:hypothetical protein
VGIATGSSGRVPWHRRHSSTSVDAVGSAVSILDCFDMVRSFACRPVFRVQIDIYRTAQQVRQSRHVAAWRGTKYLAARPRPLGRHLAHATTAPGGFEASFVLRGKDFRPCSQPRAGWTVV